MTAQFRCFDFQVSTQNQIEAQRLRSRWRLCRLTDAACPLRVSGFDLERSRDKMSER